MSDQNTRNKKYIGNKMIEAAPMTKFEYNRLKNKNIPGNDQDGYLVGYYESMNKTDKVNYWSWSPKEQFEESYEETNGLNFGIAIELMKKGFKVARQGWNGKGMYIFIQESSMITKDKARNKVLKNIDGDIKINSHIDMKAADGSIVIGWLASQTDMLSNDWIIVE